MNMADAISKVDELGSRHELSIIRLSEPILAPLEDEDKRTSNASTATDPSGVPTPASLEADLAHYQDLFTKLRFSYVEQVTKEKFLRAVVGDPPMHVTPAENSALESELATMKATLKAQKTLVASLIAELEKQGRQLAQRHSAIQLKSQQLRDLPIEIEGLSNSIASLREEHGYAENGKDTSQSLPLPATLRLVEERERELELLNQQLLTADADAGRKQRELERLKDELVPLEAQKNQAIAAAREAQKRKEEGTGGLEDEIEQQGRWLQSAQAIMQHLLDT